MLDQVQVAWEWFWSHWNVWFDGILVVPALGVVVWIWHRAASKEQEAVPARNASPQAPATVPRIDPVTPKDIREAMRNAVPLQQEVVADSYRKITVRWTAPLFAASMGPEEIVQIALLGPDGFAPHINFKVKLTDYPSLRIVPKGTLVTVQGRIDDIGVLGIDLSDVTELTW